MRFSAQTGALLGVTGNDVLTGEPFRYAAPVVVNVAGPWVDEVLARSNIGQQSRLIGGSKGSHIVVDPFPGAPRDALYAEARQDGRPFFIIPWNDLYLIGTTDTRYDGDLDRGHGGGVGDRPTSGRDQPGYPDPRS